jgi:hypothetical protein
MEAGKEVRSSILCIFMLIFMVGLLREKLSLYYSLVSLQFRVRGFDTVSAGGSLGQGRSLCRCL